MAAPTIARATAGAGHIAVFLAHWAGGHTVGEEEITRRISKARQQAHAEAVAEHGRLGKAAHKKATRLRRSATENGGLVPAAMTALAAAEHDAARHDAARVALGEFTVPMLDPGHVKHRRHRIAAFRCMLLAVPVGGVLAASWTVGGSVFLFAVLGGLGACLARGDKPFALTVRPVPAELLAATPLVLPITSAVEVEAVPVKSGQWREELRLYVEHAIAQADLEGRKGVHAVDLLTGLQEAGRYLGLNGKTFPAKLRDASIPVDQLSIKGDNQLGVRHDKLTTALGRSPRLPPHLVPDITDDDGLSVGEAPSQNPSPTLQKSA